MSAARDRYRASDKGRATAAAYERGELVRERRTAWATSQRGRASRWLAKHRQRYPDIAYTLEDVAPWFAAKPTVCPYTGHARVALHMNSNTMVIEGWVSAHINWNVLPWMGDSLHTFCALNGFEAER